MKWKAALLLAIIVVGFAFTADLLAFCTGWCEVPSAIIRAPGALVVVASEFGGLNLPYLDAVAWITTLVAWFLIFLLIGFGARKVKER